MRERIAFTIGLGASLLSISLLVKGMKEAQAGPDWEVPFQAVAIWYVLLGVSILLQLIGIGSYYRGGRFKSLTEFSRKAFLLSLRAGVLISATGLVLEPMQWRIVHPDLSEAVSRPQFQLPALCFGYANQCEF